MPLFPSLPCPFFCLASRPWGGQVFGIPHWTLHATGPPPKVGGPLATFPPVLGGIGKESTRTCLCICRSTTCRDWPPHRGGQWQEEGKALAFASALAVAPSAVVGPPTLGGGQWQEGREVGPPTGGATLHATGPPQRWGGLCVATLPPRFGGDKAPKKRVGGQALAFASALAVAPSAVAPPHYGGASGKREGKLAPPQGGATLHATGPPPKVGGPLCGNTPPRFGGDEAPKKGWEGKHSHLPRRSP